MAVVVPQLVERLLPNPEVPGSNLVISKNLYRTFTVNSIEKAKIKKKRPGMAHFLEKVLLYKSPPGPRPRCCGNFFNYDYGGNKRITKLIKRISERQF